MYVKHLFLILLDVANSSQITRLSLTENLNDQIIENRFKLHKCQPMYFWQYGQAQSDISASL